MSAPCFEEVFPNEPYDVSKELLRLLKELDWSPYLATPYWRSLALHKLTTRSSPDPDDMLSENLLSEELLNILNTDREIRIEALSFHLVDEVKLEAYDNAQRYQAGDEYDFAAVREFSILMMRSKDAENPAWWQDPQAIQCRLIPSSDGTTKVVLRCESLWPDDGEKATRIENMHRAHAAAICAELGQELRKALRGTGESNGEDTPKGRRRLRDSDPDDEDIKYRKEQVRDFLERIYVKHQSQRQAEQLMGVSRTNLKRWREAFPDVEREYLAKLKKRE